MEKLREILIKEYDINHLTLDILDEFSRVNEKAAADFLKRLFKRDMVNIKKYTGGKNV